MQAAPFLFQRRTEFLLHSYSELQGSLYLCVYLSINLLNLILKVGLPDFARDFISSFICLSVCLSVCLLACLRKLKSCFLADHFKLNVQLYQSRLLCTQF